ncbi:C40 family peptidase [Nocardioides marmoraquaticus]
MTDGRKYRPAHRAERTPLTRRAAVPTVAALALGLAGSGLLAAPAGAADLDARIDRAQAQVDRLDRLAGERATTHERAQARAGASKQKVERLTQRIEEQRERTADLRERVARGVLVEHGTAAGAAGSGTPAADVVPVASTSMPATSERLLAGVALVTEDAGDTSSALQETETTRVELVERRAAVREVLQERRAAARDAGKRAERAGAELGAAQGRLASLEDERAEQQAEQVSSGAVAYAMAQVGKSYVWGAAGPDAFDCSGLTMAAWATEGVSLPHNSQAQYAAGTPVSESELQPGDLVFYYSPISHVGMYVGNGQVVNALNPGSGVQVSGLHDMPYSGAVRPG